MIRFYQGIDRQMTGKQMNLRILDGKDYISFSPNSL